MSYRGRYRAPRQGANIFNLIVMGTVLFAIVYAGDRIAGTMSSVFTEVSEVSEDDGSDALSTDEVRRRALQRVQFARNMADREQRLATRAESDADEELVDVQAPEDERDVGAYEDERR